MLVLAAPRPPESQEVKDVTISENILGSSYTEVLPQDPLIGCAPLVPLSAHSARARHREKVRTYTLVQTYDPYFL